MDGAGGERTALRSVLLFLAVALAIYLTGRLGEYLAACGLFQVPRWVASGASLTALILWGARAWPAVWVGFLGLEFEVHSSLWLAAAMATVKTAAPLMGAIQLRRSGFQADFRRTNDLFSFTLLGAVATMGFSAALSTLVLCGAGKVAPADFLSGWWERWWMEAMAALLLGPPLLMTVRFWEARVSGKEIRKGAEAVPGFPRELGLAWGALILATGIVIAPLSSLAAMLPDILILPFLVWIALRGSTLMASWATILVCAAAVWRETVRGLPPGSQAWEIHRANILAFMASVMLITLLVAVLRRKNADAQAALAESEVRAKVSAWARQALDSLPMPLRIVHEDGTTFFLNQEFTRRFGYLPEDIPDRDTWQSKAYPDPTYRTMVIQQAEEDLAECLRTGLPAPPRNFRILTKAGQVREIEFGLRLVGGQALVSLHDVTEREEQLREIARLNRFLSTLSQVNQCIVRSSSPATLFDEICDIAVAYGGFSLAWIGWADEDGRVVPLAKAGEAKGYLEGIEVSIEDRPEGRGPVGVCLREDRRVVCNDIAQDPAMAPWRDRAGSFGLRSLISVPIHEGGKARGTLGVYSSEVGEFQAREVALLEEMALDISFALDTLAGETRRKVAEEALRESETRLRLALEATGIGMWDWDLKRDVWFSTPAYFRMLGYEPTEAPQDREAWGERTHPEDRPRILAKMAQVREGGEAGFNLEFRFRHADGSYRWVNSIGRAIESDAQGHPSRMLGLQIDITDRVVLEGQLLQAQKLEALGQLAGGVAHDFNNILSAITGFAELAGMKIPPGGPAQADLDQVVGAAQRGAALTQGLLAFGRQQPMRREPLELSKAVRGFEKILRRLLPEHITLTLRLAHAPLPVLADRIQIEQILLNLVANARDAMPGGGDLAIETRAVEARAPSPGSGDQGGLKPYALLSVSDTGTGIPEDIRARIFDPFFTTKELGKGTGLGLSTIYGIVQHHDGFIDLKSELGSGTAFHIHLPLLAGDLAPGAEPGDKARGLPVAGTETVLLAEDDPAVRKAIATLLTSHGYAVIEAEDGREAIDRFAERREDIQLVILDGLMPRMGGKEAWAAIRALAPSIKALFISGYTKDVLAGKDEPLAAAEVLPKPFTLVALLAKVRAILDGGR